MYITLKQTTTFSCRPSLQTSSWAKVQLPSSSSCTLQQPARPTHQHALRQVSSCWPVVPQKPPAPLSTTSHIARLLADSSPYLLASLGHCVAALAQATASCSLKSFSLADADRRSTLLVAGGSATTWLVGGLMAAGAAAAAGGFFGENPQAMVRSGMEKFKQNDVEGSLQDFDRALFLQPRLNPYLWQRGLSLYYLEQYAAGAKQFRDDVAVNPNDTEESIWAFLCEAQLEGADTARQKMLQVGRDPRPVMRAAYECFQSGNTPEAILQAATDDSGHDTFYALLYIGLWHEAHGKPAETREAILKAVQTEYAKLSGDYMAALARVHCQRRGWAA